MACTRQVVIWERFNKTGKWCTYCGEICQLLEQSFSKNLNSVYLGDVDASMKTYTVNLKNMVQLSEETGTECAVRRRICDESNIVSNQVLWQWKGDGHDNWHCYSFDTMKSIENAYNLGNDTMDLSDEFPEYPYKIQFYKMMQINKKTKYRRRIRRINASNYPRINVSDETEQKANVGKNKLYPDLPEVEEFDKPTTKKNVIAKQVSNLWNKLTKHSDSDSESVLDLSSRKGKKKKKNEAGNGSDIMPSMESFSNLVDTEGGGYSNYALVNGKPWRHPWPPHTPESKLKPVPGIQPLQDGITRKRRGTQKEASAVDVTGNSDVFDEFTKEVFLSEITSDSEEQVCIICYEALSKSSSYDEDSTLIQLCLCSHVFHRSCLRAMYENGPKNNHMQCPMCKTIHGVKHGIQPAGTMVYYVLPHSLPGHHDCDTIQIIYDIPGGVQGPEHPNPGKRYSARGFPRYCYLPDNNIGRNILRLLVQAWERRLIFTIGSSSTTGEQNTVTWNEIHHKTEFGGNRHGHGYPDPNYFENIISELAAQGVTESTYEWFPA